MDYFYHKEHLLIVTELLRDSIFNFYRYLRDTSPEGHGAYFTLDTLRALSTQLLSALAFMHQQVCSHHNCLRSCRNSYTLSKEYLVANIGFDPTEKEPCKIWITEP